MASPSPSPSPSRTSPSPPPPLPLPPSLACSLLLLTAAIAASHLLPLPALALLPHPRPSSSSSSSSNDPYVLRSVQRSDGLCACLVQPIPGFSCAEFMVQTDDGFLLGLQRIMSSEAMASIDRTSGKPVLLLHGILLGGDVWLLNPPKTSLGFLLAQQGFDVWIANTRTTRFGYGHATYTRKDKGFWDWSLDELAKYDLPAMLGAIKSETNKTANFIGYSQGTQQLFAALSQGQLLNMVDKMVMIAPVAYVKHVNAPLAELAASMYIDRIYQSLHIYEFTASIQKKQVVDIICKASALGCFKSYLDVFTGDNCCINTSRRAVFEAYETQPTSTKNLVHLAQQYRHGTFAKYDYGFFGNLQHYWWIRPPMYDLRKIPPSRKMMLIYGAKDGLADPVDVASMLSLLPDSSSYPIKFVPQYAHMDFVLGTNADEVVYVQIINFLSS